MLQQVHDNLYQKYLGQISIKASLNSFDNCDYKIFIDKVIFFCRCLKYVNQKSGFDNSVPISHF